MKTPGIVRIGLALATLALGISAYMLLVVQAAPM